MSFSRVKPSGWAINEKLRSAEVNQLDIDHANAVDKTGDDITGDLNVISARIVYGDMSRCVMTSGSVLEVQGAANAIVSSGGFVTVQSGGTLSVAGTLTLSGTTNITAGVFSISSGVSVSIGSAVSFNGLTYFSQPMTCFNELIIDGDNVAGNVKLRVKDAAYLDIENASKARVLTGAFFQAMAGSTTEFYGVTTHKDGSVATYGGGSSLVHDDGSTEVYDSGSSVEQRSGSNWTCKGGLTISPTGTLFCSFGGTTSFATTPTFFAGYSVTAGTTAIAGTLNVTATANLSGTTNMSGTTTITGASNKLKVTSRDVRKKIPLSAGIAEVVHSDGPGGWIDSQSPTYIGSADQLLFQVPSTATDPHKYNVPIYPPDGAVIKSFEFTWSGNCELGVSLRRNGVSIGGTITTSPGTITISPGIAANTSTESYSVEFVATKLTTNETALISSLFVTFTVSEYDPGAG